MSSMKPKRAWSEVLVSGGRLAMAIAVFVAWGFGEAGLSLVIPNPLKTLGVLYDSFASGWILPHLISTFTSLILGFVLSNVLGIGIGLGLGVSLYWRTVFNPIIMVLYSIPKVVLYPVLLLVFGIGLRSQVALAITHAVFPLMMNTIAAVRDVNPTIIKVGKALRANPWQMVTQVYLPSIALPLVVAMRMASNRALVAVILGGLFISKEGLGRAVMRADAVLDVARMYAVILLLFLVAFAIMLFFWFAERRLRRRIGVA